MVSKVIIFANFDKERTELVVDRIERFFDKTTIPIITWDSHKPEAFSKNDANGSVVIVVGGDGTFLWATNIFAETSAFMVGVNAGNVGFLNEIPEFNLENYLQVLVDGKYLAEPRHFIESDNGLTGLNEIYLMRHPKSRAVGFTCSINDKVVSQYGADGLIISTTTGSTGYSYSAGGPIVSPNVKALVINPINPYGTPVRPIVISDKDVITIKYYDSDFPLFAVADACRNKELQPPNGQITIKLSDRYIKMLKTDKYCFYNTLREKLGWARKTTV